MMNASPAHISIAAGRVSDKSISNITGVEHFNNSIILLHYKMILSSLHKWEQIYTITE